MDFPIKRGLHAPARDGSSVSEALTDLKIAGFRSGSTPSSPPMSTPADAYTDFKLAGYSSSNPSASVPSTPLLRAETPISHEKSLPGGWIVQKFGGTSIGKFAQKIATEVVRAGLVDNHLAVVCSARSSSTKSEGTTNRLLRAAAEAAKPKSRDYIGIVDVIREDHKRAAKDAIKSQQILDSLCRQFDAECDELVKVLEAAQHLEEVSVGAEDRIVSKGEKLSCRFMAALLEDKGIPAMYIDMANILRPASSSNVPRLDEAFYNGTAKKLGEIVLQATENRDEKIVPVITGYFGRLPGGLLNTIGRGYTDLCAALVAVGLKAKELQVWKEVDGIFTADPRKVPTARLLSSVTPSEAAELTFYGSEVIHPFTMEQVIRARIPIRVKNVMNPQCKGTVIFPDPIQELRPRTPQNEPRVLRKDYSYSKAVRLRPKRPTAVTVKHNIVILNVHSNKRTRSHGFLMNIFAILDKYHLTVDLISSSEVHVSMALHSETSMLADNGGDESEVDIQDSDLLGAVNDLREFGTIDLVNNMAIVSLVGKQLRNMVGISGRFFKTLGDNNINIEMISQGASEINISCVIDEREADRALNVCHTSLFTHLEGGDL